MRFTVRTDQDPEVIARATTLAYLDADVLEMVPVAGLDELTASAHRCVEQFARCYLNASVNWVGDVAEFTPDFAPVTA